MESFKIFQEELASQRDSKADKNRENSNYW